MNSRRVPGWKFFNDNVDVCDVVRPGGLAALEPDDRAVAEWFVRSLGGRRAVVDIGCGSGFPGLYVAPHVGQFVGVDAAPNMIVEAQKNQTELGVGNARFEVGKAENLHCHDGEFDGALLCGVLESMDWDCVARAIVEVRRALAPEGKVAILDQDWSEVMRARPPREATVRLCDGQFLLQLVERESSPGLERDTRYLVDRASPLGTWLSAELGERRGAHLTADDLSIDPDAVLDAWHDEVAQFDMEVLTDLVESAGFDEVVVERLPVWGDGVLVLTATRPAATSDRATHQHTTEPS